MRVMLKAQTDAASGNRAVADGTMAKLLQEVAERTRAEAVYIGPQDGKRTLLFFFDLEDSSSIPGVTEPFFEAIDASVEIAPVMTLEDLSQALAAGPDSA